MKVPSDNAVTFPRGAKLTRALGLVIVAVHLLGCGSSGGLTRVVVNGNVKLDGQPVEHGQIRFIPQAGTNGPVYIQEIVKGAYSCNRAGGVPVGQHRIEILVWDPLVPLPTGPGQPNPRQLAPEKYNTKSELTATLDDSTNPVVKDFDL